jgi:hypothetical protein|tara:strand:+ start:242 stop:835 length:594 start_codon:yes stop_codon:yes gene_type:complete
LLKFLSSIFLLSSILLSQERTASFRGRPCDDTEYRTDSGLPGWKNYGEWLSECDSLADAYADSTFAIVLKERHRKQAIEDSLREVEIASIDVDLELDLDVMWETTVWEEITEIGEEYIGEVEQITAVAGVRGAEAEDEALALLYYRKSMRGLQKEDLERAYGKLMNKRSLIMKNNPNSLELKKIETYLLQIKQRINS